MQIEVIGINYKNSPVALRSKVAIGARQIEEALISLNRYVPQGLILSTCNRIEIYTLIPELVNTSSSFEFLKVRSGLSETELQRHVYQYKGVEAVKHLFKVASGLDSMIIGEYEILGQVKKALQAAQKSGLVAAPLLELFRRAVICGRSVRVGTGISQNALSVSSVAVDLVLQVAGDIKRCKLLVVGAGEAGKLVAKACQDRGATQITIASRSSRRGTAFARKIQGKWIPMQDLDRELANNDIIICCSGAPHTILKLEMVKKALKLRSERPLVIIDIGVPCNVDPEIKGLQPVFLHDIDELAEICQVNRKNRYSESDKAEKIIERKVEDFMAYWHELKVKPLVTALVSKAESIRQNKLSLALKKAPELSLEERLNVEALSKSIIQGMLHDPIQCLKANHKNEEYLRIVKELFFLDGVG